MAIYLGNLSTNQIADRLGITMSEDDISVMESFRCQSADVKFGGWHCFDLPFVCVCGGMKAAEKVRDIMIKYASKMHGEFQISLGIDDR